MKSPARKQEEIALFLATLDGQSLDEALANLELDARRYGWSRMAVRKAASEIRVRYARGSGKAVG